MPINEVILESHDKLEDDKMLSVCVVGDTVFLTVVNCDATYERTKYKHLESIGVKVKDLRDSITLLITSPEST